MRRARRDPATALGAAFVLAGTLALVLPRVRATWPLTPDAIEHLGIAHSLVSGAGFVDPVLYSTYLGDVVPPVPALAMRAPVVPLLLAVPLALGAGVSGALLAHALLACAVAAAGVCVARGLAPAAGALAFGIALFFSHPWLVAAQAPLTEAASVGAVLALVAALPAALRSGAGGAAFGVLLLLAWLTRPNLGLAAPAFALAALLALGPRATLHARPVWLALGVFVVLQQGVARGVEAATGFAPYAHYGVLLETTGAMEAFSVEKQYVGWWRFVQENADRVAATLRWNAGQVLRLLFVTPDFHWVGWLLAPALVHAWRRRDPARAARLFVAALGLALLAVALASWGAVDPRRLVLPAAACFWLLAASALAEGARRLAPRAGRMAGLVTWTPVAAALALWLLTPSAEGTAGVSLRALEAWRAIGPRSGLEASPEPRFCRDIDRDAIVSSPDPWTLYLACGNAGWVRPLDLDDRARLERHLDERSPGYLLVEAERAARWPDAPRLERVAAHAGLVLFRVRDAGPRSRPWSAPPPLAPSR